ncbi:2488_t:CDS:2, partial [Cetraspora pellucida]
MGCYSSKLDESIESMDSQDSKAEFRYIDGRRYHNVEKAKYHLPNDENESDRLHLQHFLLKYILQSNFSAPVDHILSKPGAKVLDIGCGAGSWSFDIATTYPLAKVVGLDISPHQPATIKPKNFEFVRGNVEEILPFEDNTFDFVFQRFLVIGLTKEKWPHVVNELVRVLKPGGFLELCEPSNAFDTGPVSKHILECEYKLIEEQGGDSESYQKLEGYCQNQGQLENITKEVKRCYFSTNHNSVELNKAILNNTSYALTAFKPVLSKTMQVSDEEYDKMIKITEKELVEYNSYYLLVR